MKTLRPLFMVLGSLAVALALSCGKPIFFAELEEPELCKTIPNQTMPGSTNGNLESDIDIPIGQIVSIFNQAPNAQVDIELTSLTLNAESGIIDFNSVDNAAVSIETGLDAGTISADGGLPGIVLLEYQKNPAELPGRTVTITPVAAVNLVSFLHPDGTDGGSTDGITLHTELNGDLPTDPWTADIRGCLKFDAKIYYLEKFGL